MHCLFCYFQTVGQYFTVFHAPQVIADSRCLHSADMSTLCSQNYSDASRARFRSCEVRGTSSLVGDLWPVDSGEVAVETFETLSVADVNSLASNFRLGEILGGFRAFGSLGGSITESAGIVAHEISAPLREGDGFVGKPVYVAIGDGSDVNSSIGWVFYRSTIIFEADNPVFEAHINLALSSPDQWFGDIFLDAMCSTRNSIH